MNQYKTPGYFASLLAGLFFLAEQGVFANDFQGNGNRKKNNYSMNY